MWLSDVAAEVWQILNESAIFILVGFGLAALLHVFLSRGRTAGLLTELSSRSVFLAALVGLPLPLCSCSVLPAAVALRKRGASKGATISFLISTPETSITSILLTYALLGPLLAVFRPVAALVSAVAAGLADNWIEKRFPGPEPSVEENTDGPRNPEQELHLHSTGNGLWRGLRFAFVEVFDDIIGWMLVGFIVAGALNVLVPPSVMETVFGGPFQSMLIMLVIGVPLYVCAEASTPIAAAFIASGVNPGAALVFLLVGPATNIGSLGVLNKQLGRRTVVIYLISISLVALLMGFLLNVLVAGSGVDLVKRSLAEPLVPGWLKLVGAGAFILLAILSFGRLGYVGRLLRWIDARVPVKVNGKTAGAFVSGAALVIYVGSGFGIVGPRQVGYALRFGKMQKAELAPGLYFVWPYPIGRLDCIDVHAVRRVELGYAKEPGDAGPAALLRGDELEDDIRESFMLLADENIASVKSVVHFGVQEGRAFDYLYRNADAEQTVRSATLGALRQYLGTCVIDTILTTDRKHAEREIVRITQQNLDICDAGIVCLGFQFLDLHAPASVHDAFRDVASAMEDKETRINRARSHLAKVLPLARGQAAGRIDQAHGYAAQALGEARGRGDRFVSRVAAYAKAEAITRYRLHAEMLDIVLPRIKKYIKPEARDGNELEIWFTRQGPGAISPPFAPSPTQPGRAGNL